MKEYKSKIQRYSLIKEQTEILKKKINSSETGAKAVRELWGNDIDIVESFYVLFLNVANNTIGYTKLSKGGVSTMIVDPVLIAKYAVESLSRSVILAHNHPSGNVKPSQADIDLTKVIKKGLDLFKITTLDHIILSKDSYYSFADEGII